MKIKTAFFVVMAALSFTASLSAKRLWAKSFLDQKAPDLMVEKWLTEKPEIKGKFLLIDFWATWCPPCRAAVPELNEIQKRYGDRVVVIGISDESESDVRAMIEPKINYSVAIDTQKRMKSTLEVTGIPHVILVDPSGIVRWEGFPFLEGEKLTPEVVGDIVAKYSK